jgi:EAL domain-containing protein (putative c-di-GMP-specific phosphodiesterase class I)
LDTADQTKPDDTADTTELDRAFDVLLAARNLSVVFQPIFHLHSGEIVGLEALARGPKGSALESPRALFAAAARRKRTAELDWVCRAAAFGAFLDADLAPSISLFVNIEPESLATECPIDLAAVVARAESLLRVFVEVNDQALGADPAGLLGAVDRARQMGWGVAIDDVGSSRTAIAILPVVQAEVVKLDLRLLEQVSDEDAAAVVINVLRHVELTGASLLVERIENKVDMAHAQALGAVYGQGRHLAEPGPLAHTYPVPRAAIPLVAREDGDEPTASPFALIGDRPTRLVDRERLLELAQLVWHTARASGARPVFVAGVGRAGGVSDELGERFQSWTDEPLLFVAFGTDMPPEPVKGLRGVRLSAGDALADERFLIILTENGPLALLARSSLDAPDVMFDAILTQDPNLVHDVVRHLIRHVPPSGVSNDALRVASPRSVRSDEGEPPTTGATSKAGWRGLLRPGR